MVKQIISKKSKLITEWDFQEAKEEKKEARINLATKLFNSSGRTMIKAACVLLPIVVTAGIYNKFIKDAPSDESYLRTDKTEYHQPTQDTVKYSPTTNTDYILKDAKGNPLEPTTF